MARSIADLDRVVELRATQLAHRFIAGRRPFPDGRKRAAHQQALDAAFDVLVRAVEKRDRAIARAFPSVSTRKRSK